MTNVKKTITTKNTFSCNYRPKSWDISFSFVNWNLDILCLLLYFVSTIAEALADWFGDFWFSLKLRFGL